VRLRVREPRQTLQVGGALLQQNEIAEPVLAGEASISGSGGTPAPAGEPAEVSHAKHVLIFWTNF